MKCTLTACNCTCPLCERAKEFNRVSGHCHRHDSGCHWKGCSG